MASALMRVDDRCVVARSFVLSFRSKESRGDDLRWGGHWASDGGTLRHPPKLNNPLPKPPQLSSRVYIFTAVVESTRADTQEPKEKEEANVAGSGATQLTRPNMQRASVH